MTVYVCSYGGCASKVFGRWLKDLGYEWVHVHSRIPPPRLCHVYQETFLYPDDDLTTQTTRDVDPADCKVVFLYRNPVESLLSRFDERVMEGAFHKLQVGMYIEQSLGTTLQQYYTGITNPKASPIVNYINTNTDLWGYRDFFDHYMSGTTKNYDIIAVNYHKMWDDRADLYKALDIDEAVPFFDRIEKTTSSITTASDGVVGANGQITDEQHQKLCSIYKDMIDEILELPAVKVIYGNTKSKRRSR